MRIGPTEAKVIEVLKRAKNPLPEREISKRTKQPHDSYGNLLNLMGKELVKRRQSQSTNRKLQWEWSITKKGRNVEI